MRNWCQDGARPTPPSALLSLTAAGLALAAMPELMPHPAALLPLGGAGLLCWWQQRRERGLARRLQELRLSVHLPMARETALNVPLDFSARGQNCWVAQHHGCRIHIRWEKGTELPWQLSMTPHDSASAPLPVTAAQSLDAMLSVARRLIASMMPAGHSSPLDYDLSFPINDLPYRAGRRLTALAEGGYALHTRQGEMALASAQAERLLRGDRTVLAA